MKGMSKEEASNMAFELAVRSIMCMAYAFKKKAYTFAELQALKEKFNEAVKSNKELTLRLAEVEKWQRMTRPRPIVYLSSLACPTVSYNGLMTI